MADENNKAREHQQAAEPALDLRSLDRLVGTWEVTGDYVQGQSTYEWMEGGFFLLQRFDFETPEGRKVAGIEVVGHEHAFGAEPSEHVKSRAYTNTGDTLDYVYDLEGDTLTIWGGEKGSPAYFKGTFSADGDVLTGAGTTRPGGGYEAISTRVG